MRYTFLPAACVTLCTLAAACSGGGDAGNSYLDAVSDATSVSAVQSSDGKAFFVNDEGVGVFGPYDGLSELHDGLIRYQQGVYTDSTAASYGYVDAKVAVVIPATYVSASDFSEGIAFVAPRDSSLRAIDREGKVLFHVPEAVSVNVYMGGYARASDIEGRIWLIDRKGTRIDFPDSVSSTGIVSDGFVVGRVGDSRRLYRIADGHITRVSELDNMTLRSFDAASRLAIVTSGDNYGLADLKGRYVVNPQYKKLKFDGRYICCRDDKGKIGFLDSKGRVAVAPQYADVRFRNDASGGDYFIVSRDGALWEIIDASGKTVIAPEYDRIMHLTGNLFAVGKGGKTGIADAESGRVTCDPQFADVVAVGRVLFASAGSSYAVVNSDGRMLGPEVYGTPQAVYADFAETGRLSAAQRASMIRLIMDNLAFGQNMAELAESYGLDISGYTTEAGEWPLAGGSVPGMDFILVGSFGKGPVANGSWNAMAIPDSYILITDFASAETADETVRLLTADNDWRIDPDYTAAEVAASPALRFTRSDSSPYTTIAPEEQ